MSNPDDFAASLARVYHLLGEHPPHHPAVRVALAETLAMVEPGPLLTWRVTSEGLAGSAGPIDGTRILARALEGAGLESVEVDPEVTSDELEDFLARALPPAPPVSAGDGPRPEGAHGPQEGGPPGEPHARPRLAGGAPEGTEPAFARSVAALFGGGQVADGPWDAPGPGTDATGAAEPDRPWPSTFAEAVNRFAETADPRLVDSILQKAPGERPDQVAQAVERCVLASTGGTRDPRVTLARRLGRDEVLVRLAERVAESRDPGHRGDLMRVAVALDAPMARTLGRALSDAQDRGARRCFMDALVAFGPSALDTVRSMLADPRWFVVRNGVRLLPDVAGRSAVAELSALQAHADPRVRREAATGLSRVGGAQARDRVRVALEDSDPDVRAAAAVAVGILGGPEAGPSLSSRLETERDPDVAVNLIRSLARVGHTDAVAQLGRRTASRLFSRTPKPVRIAALRALWSLGTPPARSAVMQALDDRDPEVRGSVRALLGGR